jgi:trehalose/maltose transport system substrate-binding protein
MDHAHDRHEDRTRGALTEVLTSGRISRRAFLARAAALGITGTALGALLAACSGGNATATPAPAAATTVPTRAASPAATPTRAGTPAANPAATPGAALALSTPPAVDNAAAASQYSGQRITYYGDAVAPGDAFDKILAGQFQQQTGIVVNVVPKPQDATENYSTYQRFFQAQSPDLDAMMLDVTWPAAFAQHLIDLNPALGGLAAQCYPTIIANNTVNGSLVGMPWFGDFGMLYYRTDLLRKYGIAAPPATWDDLAQQAGQIVGGEKASNPTLAGFVFQGSAYEGLTCDALEWVYSSGGGQFIENGQVTINNPQAAAILTEAKGWVGTIAPQGVTTYQEADTANAFVGGNAAFARNWPYMYTLAADPQNSKVAGKFDVAPLPAAAGQQHVGTVGGWQLGVSRYSKAQNAAIEFVRYMAGPAVVTWRAVVGTYVPLYPAVAADPAVLKNQPYLQNLASVQRVTRPSNALGANYNQGSTIIFQGINQVLTGGDANQQLPQIQQQLQRLLS